MDEEFKEHLKRIRKRTLAAFICDIWGKEKEEKDEEIKAFYKRVADTFNTYLLYPAVMRQKRMTRIILDIADEFKKQKIYNAADEIAMIPYGMSIEDLVIDWNKKAESK
jgi:hypothetical protein